MPGMPDLMLALLSLQEYIDNNMCVNPCATNALYKMIFDKHNEVLRYTYAKIVNREVQAMANFALVEPIRRVHCFNIGYAVKPSYRGKSLSIEAVNVGIEELKNGLSKQLVKKKFYIEAVIEISNQPSIKVAEKLFLSKGKPIVDAHSGEQALYFKKLVKF